MSSPNPQTDRQTTYFYIYRYIYIYIYIYYFILSFTLSLFYNAKNKQAIANLKNEFVIVPVDTASDKLWQNYY